MFFVANVGGDRKRLHEPWMARFSLTLAQPARQLGSAVHREVLGMSHFRISCVSMCFGFQLSCTDPWDLIQITSKVASTNEAQQAVC